MVRLAGEGLRSLRSVGMAILNQERLLYPAPRSPFIGPGLSGSGLYNALGRAFWAPLLLGAAFTCALSALRGTSSGETMTTPGGAGTTHPPVLGAPASISWGRSFLSLLCSGPSSLPRPDALSPPPAAPMPCGFLCRRAQTTSERLPLPGRSTPSPAFLALSGRGDATFHVGLNFALTEFSEVPC
jgi:hypothetical protein